LKIWNLFGGVVRASFVKIWSLNDGVNREFILPNIGWFFGYVEFGITKLFLKLK
jgi:hypothetical protein